MTTTSPHWCSQNGVGFDQKLIAEAASHEVGHTGGLSHDGNATSPYDWDTAAGRRSWARPTTSRSPSGARASTPAPTRPQDDFAVMQSNGLLPVADDYPERSPAPLAPGVPRTGIVSSRSDVDTFAITIATATTVTVTATPAAVSPDLDISLTLSKGKETIAYARIRRRRTSPPTSRRASMPASPPPCRLARTPPASTVSAPATRSTPATRTTPASAPTP